MEAAAGDWGMRAGLRGVWVREEWAGGRDVSGRAVQSGSGSGVRVWSAMELEAVPAAVSLNARKLCRTCGEGRTAWAERGPGSACWASCVQSETKRKDDPSLLGVLGYRKGFCYILI